MSKIDQTSLENEFKNELQIRAYKLSRCLRQISKFTGRQDFEDCQYMYEKLKEDGYVENFEIDWINLCNDMGTEIKFVEAL